MVLKNSTTFWHLPAVIVLLTACASFGQDVSEPVASGERWTVEKSLQRAREANPDLVAARLEYERLRGVRMQVRAKLLPQLNLAASADKRDDGLIDRTREEFARPPDTRSFVASSSYDARVEVRQSLFDGLETWNQTKRYHALVEQARLTMEAVTRRTESLVQQTFDAVLWRRDAMARESERLTALRKVVDATIRKQAVGEIAEFERYRAEAELKLAESDLVQARSNAARAEQAFRRLLMIPNGETAATALFLEGELKPRSIAWTLEAAIKVARAHRPDLAAAAATLKAAQYGVRAANSGYLPKIDAYLAYGARSSYFDESQRLEGWSGGAVARWSIFDGLETRGRVRSQLAERRAAEVRLGDVNYQIDSQLKELFAGLELSQSAVDSQRTATDLAKRSVAQARRLHQLGQASFEQVLQAEVSSRRAELGFLEAIFNHNSTISQIEYSVGGAAAVQSLEKR